MEFNIRFSANSVMANLYLTKSKRTIYLIGNQDYINDISIGNSIDTVMRKGITANVSVSNIYDALVIEQSFNHKQYEPLSLINEGRAAKNEYHKQELDSLKKEISKKDLEIIKLTKYIESESKHVDELQNRLNFKSNEVQISQINHNKEVESLKHMIYHLRSKFNRHCNLQRASIPLEDVIYTESEDLIGMKQTPKLKEYVYNLSIPAVIVKMSLEDILTKRSTQPYMNRIYHLYILMGEQQKFYDALDNIDTGCLYYINRVREYSRNYDGTINTLLSERDVIRSVNYNHKKYNDELKTTIEV